MEIHREHYFSITGNDSAGELARITATLMEARIDCAGIWGFSLGKGKAKFVVIPRNHLSFKEFAKQQSWKVTEGTCFRLDGSDKTGALVDVLKRLADEGINLEAVDAIAVGKEFGCYLWGHEDEVVAISEVLGLRTPLM